MLLRKILFILLFLKLIILSETNFTALNNNFIQIGLNQFYYYYSEKFDNETLLKAGVKKYKGEPKSDEYGYTALFHFAGTGYSKLLPFYGNVFFEAGNGKHKYDGSTQDSLEIGIDTTMIYEPYFAKKRNMFIKIGGYGGPYFMFKNVLLAFYSGLEYQYWKRSLSGIREFYRWFYAPIGIKTAFKVSDRINISCNLLYKFMLYGTMEIDFGMLEKLVTLNAPDRLILGKKQGFKGEIPIQINLNKRFNIECKPWFEYRPSGISNVDILSINNGMETQKSPILEPASTSYSGGLTISVMLCTFYNMNHNNNRKY